LIDFHVEERKLNSKKDNMRNIVPVATLVYMVISLVEALRVNAVIISVGFVFFGAYGILWAHHRDEVREISRRNQKFYRTWM